jgi:putative ABC transport system ATP-binding protein
MVLKAEGISKTFRRVRNDSNMMTAVAETNITLEPGKIYVVSGPSGSGKSTLLNMLSGLLAPTTGKVLLDNRDLYALDDSELSAIRNQTMGFLPQGQTAIHSLTVLENVLVPYTLHGRHARKEKDFDTAVSRAKALLSEIGIADLADVMPSELSGGEIRRMAIARALIHQPAFLFADEPTGDLDKQNTKVVLSLFRQLAQDGISVFLVSHDADAFPYADVIYEMEKGIINDRGTVERNQKQG